MPLPYILRAVGALHNQLQCSLPLTKARACINHNHNSTPQSDSSSHQPEKTTKWYFEPADTLIRVLTHWLAADFPFFKNQKRNPAECAMANIKRNLTPLPALLSTRFLHECDLSTAFRKDALAEGSKKNVNLLILIPFELLRCGVGLLEIGMRLIMAIPVLLFVLLIKIPLQIHYAIKGQHFTAPPTSKIHLAPLPLWIYFLASPLLLMGFVAHSLFCLLYATINLLHNLVEFTLWPIPLFKTLRERYPGAVTQMATMAGPVLLGLGVALLLLNLCGTLPFMPPVLTLLTLPALPLWQSVLISVVACYLTLTGTLNLLLSAHQHLHFVQALTLHAEDHDIDRLFFIKMNAVFSYPSIELARCIDLDKTILAFKQREPTPKCIGR